LVFGSEYRGARDDRDRPIEYEYERVVEGTYE
jgi:hypothetical protein